ncbi:MAG TPA: hypothetical protein VFH61_09175 [Thermoleophilia bacterium]|nr:hypothetical protein [Thermoleophilia bacterium]
MAQTFVRQDAQIGSSLDTLGGFVDNTAPAATMESGASTILDDLNNMRSIASLHLKADQSLPWYSDLTAPSALEAGSKRGIDEVNSGLHAIEKKRVLRDVHSLTDVTVTAAQNWEILGGGELPANTTAAVGAVTTLGTVVAAHGGTFGTHSLTEVSGTSAISPKNLMLIVDGATRDPILSSGRQVYGLLHGESGVTDGATITGTTTTRVQISFVRVNATGDDLEACPVGDIAGATINYCTRERVRLEDLNEADFLSGAIIDTPAGSTVDRQTAYTNQGATVVTTAANATLDLGAGLTWEIGDLASAGLFQIIEGSGGGTSQLNVGAAVDEYDNDAILVNFASGISARSGGTRPINVGVTDGVIETTAGDLKLDAFAALAFEDVNRSGSSYGTDLVLSDASSEWSTFETNFGEVSLLNAINQAYAGQIRTKVQSAITGSNPTAGTDVNGPGTPHNNCTVDLAPFDGVTFVDDVEVFLNGELLRNDASSGGSNDVYPGGTPADGDLAFNFQLKGTGTKPDQLTVIVNGQ